METIVSRDTIDFRVCICPICASDQVRLTFSRVWVGDAAIMVDPHDHAGLARAVADVLTHHDLRQGLIAKGLSRVRLFTSERSISALVKVYEEICAESTQKVI